MKHFTFYGKNIDHRPKGKMQTYKISLENINKISFIMRFDGEIFKQNTKV